MLCLSSFELYSLCVPLVLSLIQDQFWPKHVELLSSNTLTASNLIRSPMIRPFSIPRCLPLPFSEGQSLFWDTFISNSAYPFEQIGWWTTSQRSSAPYWTVLCFVTQRSSPKRKLIYIGERKLEELEKFFAAFSLK